MFSALVTMKSAVIIISLYFFGRTGEVEESFDCHTVYSSLFFPVDCVVPDQVVVPQGIESVNGSSANMGCTCPLVDSGGVLVCESQSYLIDGVSPDINTNTSDWASQLVTVRRSEGSLDRLSNDGPDLNFPHVLLTLGFDTAVSLTGIEMDWFLCPDWGIGDPDIFVYLNEDYNLANNNIFNHSFVLANDDSPQSSCDSLSTVTFSGGSFLNIPYRTFHILVDLSQHPSIEWVHVGEVRFIFLQPTLPFQSLIMLSSSSLSCESLGKSSLCLDYIM